MKSKKGFTLVELMIVVVIMAILVAVAVPIYSAVTANAKKKTCVANQREIVSQLNTLGMSNVNAFSNGTIKLVTNADGDGIDESQLDMGGVCDSELFFGLFQVPPYCPIAGNSVFIEVEKGAIEGELFVHTYCKDSTGTITDHEYSVEE